MLATVIDLLRAGDYEQGMGTYAQLIPAVRTFDGLKGRIRDVRRVS